MNFLHTNLTPPTSSHTMRSQPILQPCLLRFPAPHHTSDPLAPLAVLGHTQLVSVPWHIRTFSAWKRWPLCAHGSCPAISGPPPSPLRKGSWGPPSKEVPVPAAADALSRHPGLCFDIILVTIVYICLFSACVSSLLWVKSPRWKGHFKNHILPADRAAARPSGQGMGGCSRK